MKVKYNLILSRLPYKKFTAEENFLFFLIIAILAFPIIGGAYYFISEYYHCYIFPIGVFFSLLLMYYFWEKLYTYMYYFFFRNHSVFYEPLLKEVSLKNIYPKSFISVSSIDKFDNIIFKELAREKIYKTAFLIVPLNKYFLEGNNPKDIKNKLSEIINYTFVFKEMVNIYKFFIVTFFSLFLIYSILSIFIYEYLLTINKDEIVWFKLLIVLIFFIFIYIYIKNMEFKFYKDYINNSDKYKGFAIYKFEDGQKSLCSHDDLLDNIREINENFQKIMVNILQVATPIFLISFLQIIK